MACRIVNDKCGRVEVVTEIHDLFTRDDEADDEEAEGGGRRGQKWRWFPLLFSVRARKGG